MAIVYLLRNPLKDNKIFYVGMSIHDAGDRPWAHMKEAVEGEVGYNPHKNRTIQKIVKAGLKVGVEIIETGVTKEQAAELEIFLIAFLGRRAYEKWGILCNITKGGDGNTSERTAEDIALLRKIGQDRWNVTSLEDKKAHGDRMRQGLREKLKNDPEFRKSYSKAMSKNVSSPENMARLIALGKRSRDTEADRLGRIQAAKTTRERGHKRDKFTCELCNKTVGINTRYQHGENKCVGDKTAMKDASGNKGNYVRLRASCIKCQEEMIIAMLTRHHRSYHE